MDKDQIGNLLRRLVSVDGLSGAEERVSALVQELSQEFADEVRSDALGNVIALKRGAGGHSTGSAPGRLMLAAHMDEIGLVVTRIEGSFLHVGKIGGIDPRSVLGQEVVVYASGPGSDRYPDGLPGYVGSRPPHLLSPEEQSKVIPLHDLRVDLGSDRAGALVRVGDRIAIRGPYTELLNGRVAAKSLDNRASVAAMLGAMGYLAQMQHSWDVYAVATVQEEVGLRGAITGAFGVAPDVAMAIDVTFAHTPGLPDTETVEANKGAAIDWGPNLHPGIVKKLRETADALEMPYVMETAPGASGTDAWAIQISQDGIPTGLLSIPVRYMHSATEMVALADIDRTARLMSAFISRLDDTFLAGLPEEV